MATEGTKFQVNYKLADGTLINLYAASATELEAGLADLAMNATNIRMVGTELSGSRYQNVAAPTTEAVAQAFNATPVQTPTPSGSGNTCKHGAMTLRSGVGQKGPWSGWMCAAPKGAPDKCDTIWVR